MSTPTARSNVPRSLAEGNSGPDARSRARRRRSYAVSATLATFTLWLPLGASIEPHGAASLDAVSYGDGPKRIVYQD